ncbi:MAG: transposase [Opitutaceae bacterium]
MARRLRIQFPGAIYHVINRGNYRRDLFESVGVAKSFEAILGEASTRFGWEIHAFCLLRNHFHVALTTPVPTLGDGMHWLQTTFAVRFNRFRSERGHLFQGRYQSPLVEDAAALVRVVDYIHLNPVQAGIVSPEQVAEFRWSSLSRFVKGSRPAWLSSETWRDQLGMADSRCDWDRYVGALISLARDPEGQKKRGFDELTRGCTIGTHGWKRAIAREHSHRALELDLPRDETIELKAQRWRAALDEELRRLGKDDNDSVRDQKGAAWKVEIALRLRRNIGAPYRWISKTLAMGSPAAVRVAVCRLANM